MSGSSVSNVAPTIERLLIPYSIDGKSHEIECVVTAHGHPLINASQYAAAFIGCKLKMSARKIAVIAARIPELDHMGRVLIQHDKVYLHLSA